ncbi:MAG: GHKL domain-containing protein [Betaproteobacteria bacterium]|nr:MAG: GHKL domain-containing protein [Betaproteobacteria bacterium]
MWDEYGLSPDIKKSMWQYEPVPKKLCLMNNMTNTKSLLAEELKKESPDWRLIERLSRSEVDSDPASVRFSVDAGHIQRLGLELVAKQETALAELIKNAYDADATNVSVVFSNHDQPNGTLVIEDNGVGMAADIVRDSWMCISTANKQDSPVSQRYGRIRAGRKGIGRFAVQRLGKQLIMETEVLGEPHGLRVVFEWDAAFQSGLSLHDVFSSVVEYNKPLESERTRLIINGLRESWSEVAMQRVWKAVLLLQPPFKLSTRLPRSGTGLYEPDPGFEVSINGLSTRQRRTELSIEKGFLDHGLAEISGSVSSDGRASVSVRSAKLGINETQEYEVKYLLTGPLSFSARYFIYDAETLPGINVNIASELSRSFGGIRIYRNGFRVLPYGEATDDWLRLDWDVGRRHLLVPGNNRNFFGQVELDGEQNILFEETSSREGLIENEAFEELRGFVRSGVEWAIKRVAAARGRKQTAGQRGFISKARPRKPTEVLTSLLTKIEETETGASSVHEAGETSASNTSLPLLNAKVAFAYAKAELEEWERDVEERQAASLQYEEMLRILASLGLSITVFGHEIKGIRSSVATHLDALDEQLAGLIDDSKKEQFVKLIAGLKSATGRMFDLGGYIAGLMSSTESRQLRSLSVKGALEHFTQQFRQYMERQKVEFEVDISSDQLRTIEMHSSELDSVLLNFLTNSIKSMKKAKAHPRRVRISAREDGEHIFIAFEDNGGGVPSVLEGRIFDAFFTTTIGSDDDGVAGPGTGLGLKIVSDIAHSYGGSVKVGAPSEGFNCCLEFRILSSPKVGKGEA